MNTTGWKLPAYPLFVGAPDTITRVDVSRDALKVTVAKFDGEKLDQRVISPSVPAVPMMKIVLISTIPSSG